jgi:hypothetical protein
MIAAPVASGNNNRYILNFTDAVSKYAELVAISDRTAETVAKAIFTKWICRYGVPTEIIINREKRILQRNHGRVVQGNEAESRVRMSVSKVLLPRKNGKQKN